MVIEVGDPVYLGFQPADGVESGAIYSVGAAKRSNAGRLVATGTVIVVVPNDEGYDEGTMKTLAKQKAISMISDNPELLTAITRVPNGPTHPERDDGNPPPWAGDGFLDPPDDDPDTDEPKRILSPDSPQAGQ